FMPARETKGVSGRLLAGCRRHAPGRKIRGDAGKHGDVRLGKAGPSLAKEKQLSLLPQTFRLDEGLAGETAGERLVPAEDHQEHAEFGPEGSLQREIFAND